MQYHGFAFTRDDKSNMTSNLKTNYKIFSNGDVCILIEVSLKSVPRKES